MTTDSRLVVFISMLIELTAIACWLDPWSSLVAVVSNPHWTHKDTNRSVHVPFVNTVKHKKNKSMNELYLRYCITSDGHQSISPLKDQRSPSLEIQIINICGPCARIRKKERGYRVCSIHLSRLHALRLSMPCDGEAFCLRSITIIRYILYTLGVSERARL